MRLESIEEIRAQGVMVYPHVAGWDAQPLDVSRWQLSPWAKWVAADADGTVHEFEKTPIERLFAWITFDDIGKVRYIGHIDLTGIDWRRTLTPVNQEQQGPVRQNPVPAINTLRNRVADRRQIFSNPSNYVQGGPYTTGVLKCLDEFDSWLDELFSVNQTPAKPATDEHIAVATLAWQLSQLSADDVSALARQLAHASAGKANMLAEALWSEAMDAEHAALQVDDAVMEKSNRQAVWGDDDCACQLAATQ